MTQRQMLDGKRVICVDEGVQKHPADYVDYDFPDFETERKKILEKWRSFIKESDKDMIYVFNCIFLQNPAGDMLPNIKEAEKWT